MRKLVVGQELAPIARRGGLNATYLRDVLERGQMPQLKNAQKLSGALGVPLTDWFLLLEPEGDTVTVPRAESPAQEPPLRIDLMPRDFPVFGSAQCGEDGAFEFNTGEAIDYVRRPPRLTGVKNAYALYVSGQSMRPWREEGQLVYVHAGQPPKIGDYVVIQIKAPKAGDAPLAYIKKLEKRTGKEIVVSQFNPPETRSWPLSRVISVHRIVDWTELLGI